MKKLSIIFSFIVFLSVMSINAQEYLELTHRHELKLNLLTSVFSFPEVSYEYILSEDMTVGAAMGFDLSSDTFDGYTFKTTPFARWFFSLKDGKPATGFFVEANGALGSQKVETWYSSTGSDSYLRIEEKSLFAAGLGFALGWKYLSKNNWTGEVFFGLGRNLIYDRELIGEDVSLYSRVGVSIGKRF